MVLSLVMMPRASDYTICTSHGAGNRAQCVQNRPSVVEVTEATGASRTVTKRKVEVSLMIEGMVLDRAKGEFRFFGRRHGAVDAQSLCNHLDSLVGPVVARARNPLYNRDSRRSASIGFPLVVVVLTPLNGCRHPANYDCGD